MAQGKHTAKRMRFKLPKGPGDIDEVGEDYDPFEGLDIPDPDDPSESVEGETVDDEALAEGVTLEELSPLGRPEDENVTSEDVPGEEPVGAQSPAPGAATEEAPGEEPGTATEEAPEEESVGAQPPAPDAATEEAPGEESVRAQSPAPDAAAEEAPGEEPVGAQSPAPDVATIDDPQPTPAQRTRSRTRRATIIVCAIALLVLAAVGAFAYFEYNQTPDVTGQRLLQAISASDTATVERLYAGDAAALDSVFEDSLTESAGLGTAADVRGRLNDSQKRAFDSALSRIRGFDLKAEKWGEKDGEAFVEFTVTSYDFGALHRELMSDYLAQGMEEVFKNDMPESASSATQRFVALFEEKSSALTEKSHETTARVFLHRVGVTWKVDELSASALDALTGGLASQTAAAKAQL